MDVTEKRVKKQLDKEGVQMDMTEKRILQKNLTKKGAQLDDMTEKRVKEQLDKEGGPNGRHDREESPSRVT